MGYCTSPIYAVVAVAAISKPDPGIAVIASMSWAIIYALLGFLLIGLAALRCNKIIENHEAVLAEADRRLADEDRRRAERQATALSGPCPEALVYLNRLGDALFVCAREANRRASVPDVTWKAKP